jgi:hypothetical protein
MMTTFERHLSLDHQQFRSIGIRTDVRVALMAVTESSAQFQLGTSSRDGCEARHLRLEDPATR